MPHDHDRFGCAQDLIERMGFYSRLDLGILLNGHPCAAEILYALPVTQHYLIASASQRQIHGDPRRVDITAQRALVHAYTHAHGYRKLSVQFQVAHLLKDGELLLLHVLQ